MKTWYQLVTGYSEASIYSLTWLSAKLAKQMFNSILFYYLWQALVKLGHYLTKSTKIGNWSHHSHFTYFHFNVSEI